MTDIRGYLKLSNGSIEAEKNTNRYNQENIPLYRRIDEVNPMQNEDVGTTGSDVFEI